MIDDAIKSAADIGNPDIRKQMQDNWNAVIAPTMFEGGRAICLGTRFRMMISTQLPLTNKTTGLRLFYQPSITIQKQEKRNHIGLRCGRSIT